MISNADRSQSAARVSLIFNVLQTILKVFAAVITGSVSILSEALHSASDVLSSVVSYVSVKASVLPPDDEHPYGHGKIDTLAGLSESIMLFLFAIYTIAVSISRLFRKPEVASVDVGMIVITVCAIGAFLTMRYVGKVAKETKSLALQSNEQHFQVDIVTTVGVLVALLITKLTGWQYADPIFAVLLSSWLCFGALKLVHRAFHEAIDRHIDPAELEIIKEILAAETNLISYHKLRTRHSGSWHYIDIHLVVPRTWTLVEAHELADRVEKKIESSLAPAVCTIHVDPDDEEVIDTIP